MIKTQKAVGASLVGQHSDRCNRVRVERRRILDVSKARGVTTSASRPFSYQFGAASKKMLPACR
jgi:hypothetical protein